MRVARRAACPLILAALVLAPGCRHAVRGQPLGTHVLPSQDKDFAPDDPSVAVLHYYGVGGWGILWQGEYLLTAPYFSNHDLLASSVCTARPDEPAIAAGFAHTPFARTKAILVGHGHVDHAADIPAYPFAGTTGDRESMPECPTLIADQSTLNLLGDDVRSRVCAVAVSAADDADTTATCAGPCATGSFRITPLPWAHAPHVGSKDLGVYLTFGSPQGTQQDELHEPPAKGNGWLVGRTWGFLIELLDGGTPVFRILYVDAAASPDFVAPWPALGDTPVDVHIACMPDYDLVDGYPAAVLQRHRVKHVLAGHWEDFFRPRDATLRPVAVLSDRKMTAFVDQVEQTIGAQGKGPINKAGCKVGKDCGPHDDRPATRQNATATWTVPIPGETFWFGTGDRAAAHDP